MEGVTPPGTKPEVCRRRRNQASMAPLPHPSPLFFSNPQGDDNNMSPTAPRLPSHGVSPKIKIAVLLLTVITVAAFGLFFFKLFGKMGGSARATASAPWLEVARALENAGLKEQAAEQYAVYLKTTKMDRATRARISLTLGQLHVDRGDCRQALAWLLHAELTATDPAVKDTAAGQARACEKKLRKPAQADANLVE